MSATSRAPSAHASRPFADFDDQLSSQFAIERASLPRLLVLHRKGGSRSFATDAPGALAQGGDSAMMRAFLEHVVAGRVRFEDEGMLGIPDRTWRKAKGYVPALARLDFLPYYSVTALFAVAVLCLLAKLYYLMPPLEEEPFPAELAAVQRAKKVRKAE